MPTKPCPRIFAIGLNPRDRCRLILMKSSRKPITPRPTIRNSSNNPEAFGIRPARTFAAAYPSSVAMMMTTPPIVGVRSEEHTSELQSRGHLVCRLLLEKKKNNQQISRVGEKKSIQLKMMTDN